MAEPQRPGISQRLDMRLPWRTGTKNPRVIYDAHDNMLGSFDTPQLARVTVAAVNRHYDAWDATYPSVELALQHEGAEWHTNDPLLGAVIDAINRFKAGG